ncbi:MAG: polyhydroxyalkanoic acid system family protein [Xanthomonadales bacterium]|nr:polyhydroxyalkanoic acid system family protein [Xanthomonadales bacterium]
MSSIDIQRSHQRSATEVRDAVERLAEKMADRFGVEYGWNGDVMAFERPGVEGEIRIGDQAVQVVAELGFMLSMMKGPIEAEIHRYLDEKLG